MRKYMAIFLVMILVGAMMMLTACGNENWGVGNYTYRHVHIGDGAVGYCAEVESWHDNDIGIELHTVEFGDMYCSEGSYFLFESGSKCPFCKGE